MLDMRLSTRQVPPRLVALSFGMTEGMLQRMPAMLLKPQE